MASIWRRTNAASLLLAMAHSVWRIPVAWVSHRTYLKWRLGHQHTVLSPCQERRKERPDYVPSAVQAAEKDTRSVAFFAWPRKEIARDTLDAVGRR